MPEDTRHQSKPKNGTLTVESTWSPGPRSPAWEALWRRILDDVLPDLSDPAEADRRDANVDAGGSHGAAPADAQRGTDAVYETAASEEVGDAGG